MMGFARAHPILQASDPVRVIVAQSANSFAKTVFNAPQTHRPDQFHVSNRTRRWVERNEPINLRGGSLCEHDGFREALNPSYERSLLANVVWEGRYRACAGRPSSVQYGF